MRTNYRWEVSCDIGQQAAPWLGHALDWLPRPSGSKRGTYHWDEYNPNAQIGDHASEGSHLQIHTFEGKIIRVFYGK